MAPSQKIKKSPHSNFGRGECEEMMYSKWH
nr:MAG TPA: hypothetical protein [Caudoviricetes sp.]